jgi:hypothetical protein
LPAGQTAPGPQRQAPAELQLFALSGSQVTQATPLMPQWVVLDA